jgi:peptidyl-prolyl cis-trans isomerase SurA
VTRTARKVAASRGRATLIGAVAVALLAAAFAGPNAATAQQIERIAAVVNDEVISVYDLESRVNLLMTTGRVPDTVEARRRIAPQVLRSLINERLQLQEAKKRSISVSDQEIKQALANIERDNRIPQGQLETILKQQNVEIQSLEDQLRANLAWSKLVRRQFRQDIAIGDDEIEEVMNRVRSSQGQTQYRVAEIFLPFDSPDEEAEVLRTARRLVGEVRAGAQFDVLARQFSQSASAPAGGDLGWVNRGEMDEAVASVIDALKSGEVSEPLRRPTGFQIFLIRDARKLSSSRPEDVKVTLQQVFLPVRPDADAAEVAARRAEAQVLGEKVRGCADFETAAIEAKSPGPPKLGTFTLAELTPSVRDAVRDLTVGTPSAPVRGNSGIAVFMVCERTEAAPSLPTREDIADQIRNERMSMLARRYLRDIRLAAIVDIRV